MFEPQPSDQGIRRPATEEPGAEAALEGPPAGLSQEPPATLESAPAPAGVLASEVEPPAPELEPPAAIEPHPSPVQELSAAELPPPPVEPPAEETAGPESGNATTEFPAPPAEAPGAPALGAAAGRPARVIPPRRGGCSTLARLAALVALAAAIAAVFLVLQALRGSGHSKTAAAPKVVKVVIPEGKTRAQIAQIASAAGLSGSYRLASRRSALLSPARYGAPHNTPDLEGFLFPATYDMNPGASVARLVREQLIAFRENFGSGEIKRARALHVTPYQMLTVASMIEREAQVPADRPKIAAVIYNRLRRGTPLGIDATIYYAVELKKGIATYTHELTEAELHIDSPYNTRTHTGLPPTPISNPGVASIHAATHPSHVAYLYYVLAADGCGEHVFSRTLAAFEANVAAYQAAVKKNGGHPPTCKHK